MNILILGAFAAAFFTVWDDGTADGRTGGVGPTAVKAFAVWAFAFIPGWLYIRFLGQRAGALWAEYVLHLHRMRWDEARYLPRPMISSAFFAEWYSSGGPNQSAEENIYRMKFEASYGKAIVETADEQRSNFTVRTDTMFPVFVATAALAAGWVAVLWDTRFLLDPSSVWDVQKYAFLGAYVFTSQSLIRRFFQSDLRPAAYASALIRLTLVMLVVAPVNLLLQDSMGYPGRCVIAFGIGVFPIVGLVTIQRFLASSLRAVVPPMNPDYPLDQIDGLNIWNQARLSEEGIEDMQNLASANLVDLMVRTRIPLGRIMDWCDQTLLYIHLDRIERTRKERKASQKGNSDSAAGEATTRTALVQGSVTDGSRAGTRTRTALRQLGVRTATDLVKAFPPAMVDPLHPNYTARARRSAPFVEGLDWAQIQTLVRVVGDDPRLAPIWNWQNRGPSRRP